MSREWDKENMQVVTVNMKKEDAEHFRVYAKEHATTRGALLRGFVQKCISGEPALTLVPGDPDDRMGVPHRLTYKNTDRLKHEVAFHNPDHLPPNELLNRILDEYFDFVEKVRK